MNRQNYAPDAHRLVASLPAIYAGRPDAQGLPVARRVARIAADLLLTEPEAEPAVVNVAALFHLAGGGDHSDQAETSAAIAAAWLRGAGAPESFVAATRCAILGAWGYGETDANGKLVWHAVQLDLTSVERHSDYHRDTPAEPRARGSYLFAYREECLTPCLGLRDLLTMPAARTMYEERMPRLAAWLDEQDPALVPADWRRLSQVADVSRGVTRLLDGEDPEQVRSEMPLGGLPYVEYRGKQRAIIARSHERILELTHERIEASRNVAAEKYLESDTIHKPAVEENLFVQARRQARRLGLAASTAEDIARLLLSNAREVQERTLNDIAQRLSRLHGRILDADSPETRTEEADIAIPSLVVRTGDQPLARENELIKELRVTGLNEAYPEQRERFAQWFQEPHPYILTGQIVGSRDADLFMQALTDGQRCRVVVTMLADGPTHLGHGAVGKLLAFFQSRGAEVSLGFREVGVPRTEARRNVAERLLSLAADGLDLARVDAYLQPDRRDVVETAFQLGEATPLSVLNSALGLRLNSSATETFLPLLRLADMLNVQQPEMGGPCRTLVIDSIGGDVYVRMARNIAERFGFFKPSALYLRMMRSLTTYDDPSTGSAVEVMTNEVPQGRVAYGDATEDIRRRIARAYTGGRKTLEEQRNLGGNPDPRVCSVSSLHAFHCAPDAETYAELQRRCRAGQLLCGECKSDAADKLLEYLRQHRELRERLPATVVERAGALAGISKGEEPE